MKTFVLIVTFLIGVTASEAQTRDPFFERLTGDWTGDGTTQGVPTQNWTKWEWALDGKFFHLSLKYEIKGSNLAKPFTGQAFYRAKGGGVYEGQWFDSMGNQYPIKATLEVDILTALWGSAGGFEGKSIYSLRDAGKEFEVIDLLKQKDGTWKEFNRFKLRRN